jgi:predicted P-loop ATPase
MKKTEIINIFHITENYLYSNYALRFNVISLEIEISTIGKGDWKPCNESSLWLEMQKKNIKIPINSLIAILKSDFVERYNPLKQYFENLPKWDCKTDYIKKFSEYVKLEDENDRVQFEYHFKKWCVRAVKCVMINSYFNKQAFIICDEGNGQNIGKTSWIRHLCPNELSNYIAQDIPEQDKDARILFSKNFIINLDELASLSRKEVNKLKSYFSLDKINERLPYDKKNSIIPRIASFIGSTNMSTFLQDETGSVRWLCFVVKEINWDYRKEFDVDDLWIQAYSLSLDDTFNAELTRQDIIQNEKRNNQFQIISSEQEAISKYFEKPKDDVSEFLNATEILHYISCYHSGIRFSNVGIGKAMKMLGFKRIKQNQQYGYLVSKVNI